MPPLSTLGQRSFCVRTHFCLKITSSLSFRFQNQRWLILTLTQKKKKKRDISRYSSLSVIRRTFFLAIPAYELTETTTTTIPLHLWFYHKNRATHLLLSGWSRVEKWGFRSRSAFSLPRGILRCYHCPFQYPPPNFSVPPFCSSISTQTQKGDTSQDVPGSRPPAAIFVAPVTRVERVGVCCTCPFVTQTHMIR